MRSLAIASGILVLIVLWGFISQEFARIAEMKGHKGEPYFWWTFFFSIAGMAMVIALPDRSKEIPPAAQAADQDKC